MYTRKAHKDQRLIPITGREEVFTELGDLSALYDGLATHARQHVNPLQKHLQVPTPAPKWEELFADATLPLQVDVGCGSGRFVLIRARRLAGNNAPLPADDAPESAPASSDAACADGASPTQAKASSFNYQRGDGKVQANVLGLEIREKLVDRAQAWADRLKLTNCRLLYTNATVSFRTLLQSYPGPVELVSMQFPDPHFKKKHHKRRHVQPQLVEQMAEVMSIGSRVFLQGDVPETLRWMRDMFDRHGGGRFSLAPESRGSPGLIRAEWETPLQDAAAVASDSDASQEGVPRKKKRRVGPHEIAPLQQASNALTWSADATAGFLPENPLGVPTEREVYVAQVKAPVYRVMLLKKE